MYIFLNIGIKKDPEEGLFMAYCPDLQLATCAKTFEKAQERIDNAIRLVLDAATKRGELDKLLREYDIPLYLRKPKPTSPLQSEAWITPRIEKVSVA